MLLVDGRGKPQTDFEVDIQRGVNPKTKGSVPIIRPRLDEWDAVIEFDHDDEILPTADCMVIVRALGSQIGLLDFRPEKYGCNGMFDVE